MTRRVALSTGVTGQDGADLSLRLLDKGYVGHGVKLAQDDRRQHRWFLEPGSARG